MGLSDRFNHWQNDCIKALHINFESAEYCASFTSTNKYHTSLYFTTERIVVSYNYLYNIFIVWNTLYHNDNHNGDTITLSVNSKAEEVIRENKNGSHDNDIISVNKTLKSSKFKNETIFIVGKNALFDFLHNYDEYLQNAISEDDYYTFSKTPRKYVYSKRLERNPNFRNIILKKYNYTCIVCGCKEIDILQAAHIKSVASNGTDDVNNGYCLCANHHLLFDRGKLEIDINNQSFKCKNTNEINSCWYKNAAKNNYKLYLPENK